MKRLIWIPVAGFLLVAGAAVAAAAPTITSTANSILNGPAATGSPDATPDPSDPTDDQSDDEKDGPKGGPWGFGLRDNATDLLKEVLKALDEFTAGRPPVDDRTVLVAKIS